jgi:hypothetical protein
MDEDSPPGHDDMDGIEVGSGADPGVAAKVKAIQRAADHRFPVPPLEDLLAETEPEAFPAEPE